MPMRALKALLDQYRLSNTIIVEPGQQSPQHAKQVQALRSLVDIFGDRPFCRSQFRPNMLPRAVLPNVSLVRVEPREDRRVYRYRLFGTAMRELIGRELTNFTVDDFPKKSCRVYLTRLFDECFMQARPVFSSAMIDYPRGLRVQTEKLFVPLLDARDDVEMVLTLFTFDFGAQDWTVHPTHLEPDRVHERFGVFHRLADILPTAAMAEAV